MERRRGTVGNDRGVILVYVAIAMAMFLGFAALAVDVGHLMVARSELQKIADGAALAGARTLGRLYECNGDLNATDASCHPMPYEAQQTYVADAAAIRQASKDVALQNQAGGSVSGIAINDADIVIGNWDPVNYPRPANDPLRPTTTSPDAVRVTARRDAAANGPVTTFFARILGIDTADVSATATAALTGETTKSEGGLPFPVGISLAWFQRPWETYCNQDIKFYPTGTMEGCAGWHTYDENANASMLKKILDGLLDGDYTSPEATAGESIFDFTGGTLASAFPYMKALFDYMKTHDDDGNPDTWTTSVVVYNKTDCSNPNEDLMVVGFSTVVIHTVLESPAKTIVATVKCDNVAPGRGGGGYYGTKGSIPNLVE